MYPLRAEMEVSLKKFLALGLVAVLVAADQLIKAWALNSLEPIGQIVVIPNLFNLTYVENRGAAFGIFQDKTVLLSIISGVLLLLITIALLVGRFKPDFLLWTVAVGLAGGVGNLIDRTARGFVVDYFDFSSLFGFPVFNFADCCVVIATILILIYVIRTDAKSVKNARVENGENA